MKYLLQMLTFLIGQSLFAQTTSAKMNSATFYLAGKTEEQAKKAALPFGKLELFFWTAQTAYFKLKYVSGNSSKNMGFANDTIHFKNNKAIYQSKEDSSCKLIFTLEQDGIVLEQVSKPGAFACGFGRNVYVDGKYKNAVNYQKSKIMIGKHALSLHWIGWDQPGSATITDLSNGLYQIKGQQIAKSGGDFLKIDGFVQVVSERELAFNGSI